MDGFVIFFITPLCLLFIFVVCYGIESDNKKVRDRQNKHNQQLLYQWFQNKESYKVSLKNGNRHDVLKYGRMCGYDEQRITNDLLCYLNNL